MLWWCLTGKGSFTSSSSSLSSTACSRGKLWRHHHPSAKSSLSPQMKPVDFLSTQEVVSQPGAAVGRLLNRPSDRPHPGSVHWWELHTESFITSVFVVCACLLLMMFSFAQVNMGLTSNQHSGGTSPSFWCLSGRRPCSSADPERCQSSQQTKSVSAVKTFMIFCVSVEQSKSKNLRKGWKKTAFCEAVSSLAEMLHIFFYTQTPGLNEHLKWLNIQYIFWDLFCVD